MAAFVKPKAGGKKNKPVQRCSLSLSLQCNVLNAYGVSRIRGQISKGGLDYIVRVVNALVSRARKRETIAAKCSFMQSFIHSFSQSQVNPDLKRVMYLYICISLHMCVCVWCVCVCAHVCVCVCACEGKRCYVCSISSSSLSLLECVDLCSPCMPACLFVCRCLFCMQLFVEMPYANASLSHPHYRSRVGSNNTN